MAIIPLSKTIDTPVSQGIPQPTSPGRVVADSTNIAGALSGLAQTIGQYGEMLTRADLADKELSLKQQRQKEIGEWNTKITTARDALEGFKTELDTSPKYAQAAPEKKMELFKQKEQETMGQLFTESTPQWVMDTYQAQVQGAFTNIEQQMQSLNLQAQKMNLNAKLLDDETAMPDFVQKVINDSTIKPEEKQKSIETFYNNRIATEVDTAVISSGERQLIKEKYDKLKNLAVLEYKKDLFNKAKDAYRTARDVQVTAMSNSPAVWTQQGAEKVIAEIKAMPAAPGETQEQLFAYQKKAMESVAKTNATKWLGRIGNITNSAAQRSQAQQYLKTLEAFDPKTNTFTYLPEMDIDTRNAQIKAAGEMAYKKETSPVMTYEQKTRALAGGDTLTFNAGTRGEKVVQLDFSSAKSRKETMAKRDAQVNRIGSANYYTDSEVAVLSEMLVKAPPANAEALLADMIGEGRARPIDMLRLDYSLRNKGTKGEMMAGILDVVTSRQSPKDKPVGTLLGYMNKYVETADTNTKRLFEQNKANAFLQLEKNGAKNMPDSWKNNVATNAALMETYGTAKNAVIQFGGAPLTLPGKAGFFGTESQVLVLPGIDPQKVLAVNANKELSEKRFGLEPGTLKNAALVNTQYGYAFVKNGQYVKKGEASIGYTYEELTQ